MKRFLKFSLVLVGLALVTGCATTPKKDYTAFNEAKPASILILPPLNSSLEVNAPYGVVAQASQPIAEAGYYVPPVAVVYETLRQNGLDDPGQIHALSIKKLHEIFGTDAVLYLDVKQYGASYRVLNSVSTVEVEAELVSSYTGETLWTGSQAVADSSGGSGNFLIDLISAAITQVTSNLTDKSFDLALYTNAALFSPVAPAGGLIYGPRSSAFVNYQP